MNKTLAIQKDFQDISWKTFFTFVFSLIGEEKKSFLLWFFTVSATFIYKLFPPILYAWAVDFFITYQKGDSLGPFYWAIGILVFSHIVFLNIRLISLLKLGKIIVRTKHKTRVKGFDHLMEYSLAWHDKELSGNKVQRINYGAEAVESFFDNLYNNGNSAVVVMITFIGILIVFSILQIKYVVFAIIYIATFSFIEWIYFKKIYATNLDHNEKMEHASGKYYESVSNVLTVRSLGLKNSIKKYVNSTELTAQEKGIERRYLRNYKWRVVHSINGIASGVYLFLVGTDIVNSVLTAGTIIIFLDYFNRLTMGTVTLGFQVQKVLEDKARIARMYPIFHMERNTKKGNKNFPKNWKIMRLENIQFSYKDDSSHKDLNNISLTIKKGEKIGIVGHSGSGKSTLAKLLLGLYETDSGKLLIGDTNLQDIKHEHLTNNISIVLQESELFSMSLLENITLQRKIKPELLSQAIATAQLEPVIDKLPEGLGTKIGEKGYRLSGGERQRVGIARAICRDPQILVLDEATSALDSATELKVQKGLEKNLKETTMIIIAHRLSTLKQVDKIYVFDKGKIVEQGMYKKLLADKASIFFKLYQLQSRGKTL